MPPLKSGRPTTSATTMSTAIATAPLSLAILPETIPSIRSCLGTIPVAFASTSTTLSRRPVIRPSSRSCTSPRIPSLKETRTKITLGTTSSPAASWSGRSLSLAIRRICALQSVSRLCWSGCKMRMLVVGVLLVLSFADAQTPPPIVEVSTLSTTSEVYDLLVARNGKSLAALCKDQQIRQWGLPQGQLLRTIDTHGRNAALVLVSDDVRLLAADRDGTVMAWDATDANSAFQTKLPRYRAAAFFRTSPNTAVVSHSGKYLALSAVTDTMQVLEWPSGRSLSILRAPPGGTSAVAFSRGDSLITVARTDGILRIYDSSSGKLIAQNEDLLGESFAIDFSADGRQVVAGGADKAAIFVDAATGKLIRRIGPLADVVAYFAISPDGKHLYAKLLHEASSPLPAPLFSRPPTSR